MKTFRLDNETLANWYDYVVGKQKNWKEEYGNEQRKSIRKMIGLPLDHEFSSSFDIREFLEGRKEDEDE